MALVFEQFYVKKKGVQERASLSEDDHYTREMPGKGEDNIHTQPRRDGYVMVYACRPASGPRLAGPLQ